MIRQSFFKKWGGFVNLQQLKVFVLAVQHQKLYLVAEKLGIQQPTVTFHLNKLQEELGVPLFMTKSFHVIKLTEAGRALYHYASRITAMSSTIGTLMKEYQDLNGSRLAIGSTHTPATYMLPPVLGNLKQLYPQLHILLEVKPAPYIVDKIKQFELDLGIISQTEATDPELIYEPLVRDDLVVIVHPEHPLVKEELWTPELLCAYPLVAHEEQSISRRLADEWAESHGQRLSITMEVSGSEAMKAAVKERIGYAMVSETSVVQEVARGELYSHPIPEWRSNRQIYAIHHRNKLVNPSMRLFWQQASRFKEGGPSRT